MTLRQSIGRLSIVATLSLLALSLAACATSKPKPASALPPLPPLFHFMQPGTTNTVVVPSNCKYGVWTTDTGLKALQGEF